MLTYSYLLNKDFFSYAVPCRCVMYNAVVDHSRDEYSYIMLCIIINLLLESIVYLFLRSEHKCMNIRPIDAGLIYEKRVFHHRDIQTRYNNGVEIIRYTTEFPNIAFILFP